MVPIAFEQMSTASLTVNSRAKNRKVKLLMKESVRRRTEKRLES